MLESCPDVLPVVYKHHSWQQVILSGLINGGTFLSIYRSCFKTACSLVWQFWYVLSLPRGISAGVCPR